MTISKSYFENKGTQINKEQILNFEDNIFESKNFLQNDHEIIATDYENYAVVYECQNLLFNTYHNHYASLLSRNEKISPTYVDLAQRKLLEYGYDIDEEWITDKSDQCEFDGKTSLTTINELFETEPDWEKYSPNSENTKNVKKYFYDV